MSHPAHMTAGGGDWVAMITTLSDLTRFVEASEAIPAHRKRSYKSALNTTRRLLGNGQADLRVEPKDILRRLDLFSPAMAGMSRPSYRNLKSLMRAVFRLGAPVLAPARSRTKLTGAWQVLEQQLPVRERCQLSRFLRYAQGMGWQPDAIGEEQALGFAAYVTDEAMLVEAGKVVRITRAAWNRAVDTVPGWPRQRLEPVPPKRTPYWLREDQLPATLREGPGGPGAAGPVRRHRQGRQGPGTRHHPPARHPMRHPG